MKAKGRSKINILLVEDNPVDVLVFQEIAEERNLECNLTVVRDGAEAIHFVRREGRHSNAEAPDLMILDLNLPRLSGLEVLKTLKADEDLKRIPVLVFSGSQAEEDMSSSRSAKADGYYTKPAEIFGYYFLIDALKSYVQSKRLTGMIEFFGTLRRAPQSR